MNMWGIFSFVFFWYRNYLINVGEAEDAVIIGSGISSILDQVVQNATADESILLLICWFYLCDYLLDMKISPDPTPQLGRIHTFSLPETL